MLALGGLSDIYQNETGPLQYRRIFDFENAFISGERNGGLL